MDRARIYVGLNEMVTEDIVLLSKEGSKVDSQGKHESDLKFLQVLPEEIRKHPDDLLALRECLMDFKNHGMDRDCMMKNLEKLKSERNSNAEDILLDLMDFVAGWCPPDLSIFT